MSEETKEQNKIESDIKPKEVSDIEQPGKVEVIKEQTEQPVKATAKENGSLVNKPLEEVNSGRGGLREPKGGRPKGSLDKKTLEQKVVLEAFKQRIMKNINKLVNTQLTLAMGCSYLFKINDVSLSSQKRKHTIVTDPVEIKQFLDGELDTTKYYYITTKSPDGKAIDSLIDRLFGKATQQVDLGGGVIISKFGKLDDKELNTQIEQLEKLKSGGEGETTDGDEGGKDKETGE